MIENAFCKNERFSPLLLAIDNVPHIFQYLPRGQPIAFRNPPLGRVLYIGEGGLHNHNKLYPQWEIREKVQMTTLYFIILLFKMLYPSKRVCS